MFTDNLLISQILAVLFVLLAACLGWVAKSWAVRDRLSSTEEALKAKDNQVQALTAQVQLMEELKPADMRQHLLRAKNHLDEHARTLANRIESGESSFANQQREIEDQRLSMNQILVRIADLEHKKELLQAFANKLSELVQQFENTGRVRLESGEAALKNVASESEQLSAKIREDQQGIATCQQRIAELHQERERLQASHALLWENIRALEKRGDQLQAAADAIGSATDLLAAPAEESPRLIQSGDLERIDVPKVKAY